MKVIIDRAKWANGRDKDAYTRLLNGDGQRCCLGFLGLACGLKDNDALDVGEPNEVAESADWPLRLWHRTNWRSVFGILENVETGLIRINDFTDIDDATREFWIATGFREVLGVDVEFVGEYPKVGK